MDKAAYQAEKREGHRRNRRRALRRWAGCCGAMAAMVVVCVMTAGYLIYVLFGHMCETTAYGRKSSPDGAYVATLYMIDCGATTNFNRQVALRPRKMPWWSRHRGDPDWLGDQVLAVDGARDVTLTWTSAHDLTIAVRDDPMARRDPLRYHTDWRDVRIRWVRLPAR